MLSVLQNFNQCKSCIDFLTITVRFNPLESGEVHKAEGW